MTRTTNARLAGFMFLFYIATGIAGMVLFGPQPVARPRPRSSRLASVMGQTYWASIFVFEV